MFVGATKLAQYGLPRSVYAEIAELWVPYFTLQFKQLCTHFPLKRIPLIWLLARF